MEKEILEISSDIISLFNCVRNTAKDQRSALKSTITGGMVRNGKFYSVEILGGLIKAVAGTFGRLSYKEDQRRKPRFSVTKFKNLYTDFFVFQYYTGLISEPEQIINLTVMMEHVLEILITFEKGGKYDG